MRDKKTDEAQIGESKGEIRSHNRLQGSADSPEICDLQPPPIAGPERHNDDEHGPIAELQWKGLLPAGDAELAADYEVRRIVNQEQPGDCPSDRALEQLRLGAVNRKRQDQRQQDRQSNDRQVRRTKSVK